MLECNYCGCISRDKECRLSTVPKTAPHQPKKLNLDIKSTLVYTWSSGEVSRQPHVQIFRSLSFRCKGHLICLVSLSDEAFPLYSLQILSIGASKTSIFYRCHSQITEPQPSSKPDAYMRPHSLSHVPIHKLSPRSHHSSINHTQIHTHALLTLNSVSHFCMDPHKANKPHKQKEQQEISLLHKPQKQAHPVPKNGA